MYTVCRHLHASNFCDHTNARLQRQSPIHTASMQIPEIASAPCPSVCKSENHFVAQDQGCPAALRFCFHLLGCLRVVDPLAVTYLKSVPNEHRHITRKNLLLSSHTRRILFSSISYLISQRGGKDDPWAFASLCFWFFFSLIFSASSLHHVMCGRIGTHFRTQGMNPELWLSEITNGVTTLWGHRC